MTCGPLGFDTAGYTYNDILPLQGKWGTPSFWIRYFSPSPQANVIDISAANANNEVRAMWDGGARYLSPICAPTQSRLTTLGDAGYLFGVQDANTFGNAIMNTYFNVPPLRLPTFLGVYLDLEPGVGNLSPTYWDGFSRTIFTFQFPNGPGQWIQPLYAGLYCGPALYQANCSVVANHYCYSIDSFQPQPCPDCDQFCNQWQATPCPNDTPETLIWQMTIQSGCQQTCARGSYPHGDTDQAKNTQVTVDTMFEILFRPG
jgi:hypothetical protein